MRLTVTTLSDLVFVLEVGGDLEVEDLKALCEAESGLPARHILLFHEGKPLTEPKAKLASLGIQDGDMLVLQQSSPEPSAQNNISHQPTPQGKEFNICVFFIKSFR
jgi:DNA damage-inducible protein 1